MWLITRLEEKRIRNQEFVKRVRKADGGTVDNAQIRNRDDEVDGTTDSA